VPSLKNLIDKDNEMPEIGEIRKGTDIGYTGVNKFIWHACTECGKERWVSYRNGMPKYNLCYSCSAKRKIGDKASCWKGGRVQRRNGYVELWLSPNDFFYSMANKGGYVLEHRLVMAKHLGRCLQPFEIVHHKNGDKTDNRIDNLELNASNAEHSINHNKGYRDGYQKGVYDGQLSQIRELKQQIKLLQWQLKELTLKLGNKSVFIIEEED
jgi:hypothetical protein